MWSPSVCESQWGAGKNEFMAKSFFAKNHVKITKSHPTMGEMGKSVKMLTAIDKNEFWGKNFF